MGKKVMKNQFLSPETSAKVLQQLIGFKQSLYELEVKEGEGVDQEERKGEKAEEEGLGRKRRIFTHL